MEAVPIRNAASQLTSLQKDLVTGLFFGIAGFDGYVSNPLDIEELMEELKRVVT
jgi:hypothetical protein